MSAYLIVIRQEPLGDTDAFAEYDRQVRGNPPRVPLKPLAAYGAIHPLEGAPPDGVVVIEFANVADARRFYDSEEYQAALPFRLKAAPYQTFIVEGL